VAFLQLPPIGRLPDFLIIGAPKAGTSALHAALTQHPQLFLSGVKEPKYYMCGDSPPPTYKGPGDAHSNQEWIWQRQRYMGLFAPARGDVLCGESTPFYLYNRDARRRIATDIPHARLIAVLRDPVDRLYSNWMHLWVDGLEPCEDVVEAVSREPSRVDAGWAPFWHYQRLGLYGRQLADLFALFPREQVLLLRYRDLVQEPERTISDVCRFLGVAESAVSTVPVDNARPFVPPSPRTRVLGHLIRGGARTGAFLPPQVWRRASRALVGHLHRRGHAERPKLSSQQRFSLLEPFLADIDLLEQITGQSFDEWRHHRDGDSFHSRRSSTKLVASPR
jgi:Sulfotransferase family